MSDFFTSVTTQSPTAHDVGEGKFGAKKLLFPDGTKALLKTRPFPTDSFRGVPKSETAHREAAAYLLDKEVLDFGVVPETYIIRWNNREASVQKWIDAGLMPRDIVPGLFDKKLDDWKYRIAKFFAKVNLNDMLKVVVLDLVMNNADRHGRNVLIDNVKKRVWAIDNGLTFGRYYRGYRSILHKYLFFARLPLPAWMTAKLEGVDRKDLDVLLEYLPIACIEDTWLRIQFLLDHRDRLAYKRMGAVTGFVGDNKFPTYEAWFKRKLQEQNDETALIYSPAQR